MFGHAGFLETNVGKSTLICETYQVSVDGGEPLQPILIAWDN